MDFIKRIILIIFLVLTTLSCSKICAQEVYVAHNQVISALKPIEKDYINSKDNEFNISSISNSTSQISNRRSNNSNVSNDNDIDIELKSFKNIIKYIQNQVYLDDKNELALLLLLHQIQPNAP